MPNLADVLNANETLLSHVARIIIPSTWNVDEPMTEEIHESYVNYTAGKMAVWCGGVTTYKGVGMWKSPVVGLVKEPVTIVESNMGDLTQIAELAKLARQLCTAL